MRLNQVRHFVSIVEAGSIRAAARALRTSHPALTKSMRLLEDELHVRLVERTTRGVTLTRAGRVFIGRARAIQAEVRKAEAELADIAGERSGSVAVGIAPVAALMLGPEAFAGFLRQHPQATLRIIDGTAAALAPLVRDGTLDLAVGQKSTAGPLVGLRFRFLFRTPLVVAARRGHPLRASRSLHELAGARWIIFNPPGSGGLLERALSAAGFAFPQRFIHCESYPVAQELMARSDALMLLPSRLVAQPGQRWALVEIPVNEPIPPLVIGLYTRAESGLTAPASSMARSVWEAARKLQSS